MKNNKVCVYRHRRLDNNQIFYIGIGSIDRAYNKTYRNIFWKRIVNKTKYVVEIIYNDLEWSEAVELEIFLIELYGRKDLKKGNLINLTNGGDGCSGTMISEERRRKVSKFHKGRKRTLETRKKISCSLGKKVYCIKTGKIWNTIKECAKDLNLSHSGLWYMLTDKYINKTTIKFLENE